MQQVIHIANTNVEFEFAHPSLSLDSLEQSWFRHPLCLQLQFLPLLYAQPQDLIAITALPSQEELAIFEKTTWGSNGLPQFVLLKEHENFFGKTCQSWGASRQVKLWAEAHGVSDLQPDWLTAQQVNSKAFSFRYSCLPEAALLENESALLAWLQKIPGPKVLKSCFGLSGMGNRRLDGAVPSPELLAFCRREWQFHRPIIAEPWLNRINDFSTQWLIHPNRQIDCIGATRFDTDHQGVYQGTLAGPEEILFASDQAHLEEHRQMALKALSDMANRGFFGFVGVDALLYYHPQRQSKTLYPLVEINGRQTMSLVALRLQQKICPNRVLRLVFRHQADCNPPLLPSWLIGAKGKRVNFHKNLTLEMV